MNAMDASRLTQKDTASLAGELVSLAGMAKRLEWQSHIIHLLYQGPDFLSVHAFLKEQYQAHLEQFDVLAELVRTMGFLVPLAREVWESGAQHDEFAELTRGMTPAAMLEVYLTNLERFGTWTKTIEAQAQEVRAIDVANTMAEFCGAAWKAAWLLKSVLAEA